MLSRKRPCPPVEEDSSESEEDDIIPLPPMLANVPAVESEEEESEDEEESSESEEENTVSELAAEIAPNHVDISTLLDHVEEDNKIKLLVMLDNPSLNPDSWKVSRTEVKPSDVHSL